MKTAIEKIYYDEVDAQNIPETNEWKRYRAKEMEICEVLFATFTEEQKKLYDEMNEYQGLRECVAQLQCFKQGFKFAVKLAAEAFLG